MTFLHSVFGNKLPANRHTSKPFATESLGTVTHCSTTAQGKTEKESHTDQTDFALLMRRFLNNLEPLEGSPSRTFTLVATATLDLTWLIS